jgi:hypothetical protein
VNFEQRLQFELQSERIDLGHDLGHPCPDPLVRLVYIHIAVFVIWMLFIRVQAVATALTRTTHANAVITLFSYQLAATVVRLLAPGKC